MSLHIAPNPFFLDSNPGKRFCLYYPPSGSCLGCVLFVPPFAEEMNKSRRMVAMQARALSGAGFAVLNMDLYGTGDSDGDFRDARWEIWKNDLACAVKWLRQRCEAPITLWGLRLGTLLALDFAKNASEPLERFILWQPVVDGETYITQFLRLRVANAMLAGKTKISVKELRGELASRGTLEVAGYDLPHNLAEIIDRLKLADLGLPGIVHHWFDIAPDMNHPLSPAGTRVLEAWEGCGIPVHIHKVQGEPFWSTQEITDCPDLIGQTMGLFQERPDGML